MTNKKSACMDEDKPCHDWTCAARTLIITLATLLLAAACIVVGAFFVAGFFDVMPAQFSWWQWCLAVMLAICGTCCVVGAIASEQRTFLD